MQSTSLRSLRASTTIIILLAFAFSHFAGLLLYSLDRRETLQHAEIYDVAERAAGISVLLRNLPVTWRAEVASASASRNFGIWISAEPALAASGVSPVDVELLAYLRSLLPRLIDHEVRVRSASTMADLVLPEWRGAPGHNYDPSLSMAEAESVVLISVQHPDGEWLNFVGAVRAPSSILPVFLGVNLLLLVFVVAVVAFWLVRRVTAPLSRLAVAAERLGKNIRTEPLSEDGPTEVAQAARAFNRMQARLARLIENRTELLASISHDLRTPITQMRLRTELMPPSAQRKKNLEALDEMEATILTFLDFARAAHDREERLKIDLGALIESICADRADVGAQIEYSCDSGLLIECKRLALKRALSNLIDNALKYGGAVRVRAFDRRGVFVVRIDDSGPGIPEDQLERVFQPFYRGDRSRNRQSGEVGLGLSIAQAIVQDHGGQLSLMNRAEGGLRVEVFLPR